MLSAVRADELAPSHAATCAGWPRPRSTGTRTRLPVSLVALAARHLGFRLLPPICCERSPDIVRFPEAPLRAASHISFVSSRIDQFPLPTALAFRRHFAF